MKIERVEQFRITMPLLRPFETSFGREDAADRVITAVYAGGLVGWGEAPVGLLPLYSAETTETCWHVQRDMLIPLLLDNAVEHASDLPALFAPVRDHNMAKAGLEAAVWDLEAQRAGVPVVELVGGVRKRVDVGVSIGVQASVDALLDRIASFRAEGYRRIKVKIKPGWDEKVIAAIRARFPDVPLMADANSAYTLDDAVMLTALDGYDLLMVEQPLAHDDLLDHAALQRRMETPICLDESITTLGRAREALKCGSCRIINIKPARVGGITASKRIHDLCEANDIPVWCGGMLETGIGRAHNLAVASLPNFTLPGDISASSRYWEQDIVEPAFTLNDDGTMDVPQRVGIGVEVQRDRLERWTVDRAVYGG
jgi:O-succinylbenzoate synthase